nr:hypothetical protein [uncultured Vibrio sp.]
MNANATTSVIDRNDVLSCYAHAQASSANQKSIGRELFIVIDKTVYLDDNMKMNVHRQLSNFGKPSDKITIVTFTAVARGDYTKIPFTGLFETPPTQDERDAMNAIKLRKLDQSKKRHHGCSQAT